MEGMPSWGNPFLLGRGDVGGAPPILPSYIERKKRRKKGMKRIVDLMDLFPSCRVVIRDPEGMPVVDPALPLDWCTWIVIQEGEIEVRLGDRYRDYQIGERERIWEVEWER